MSGLLQSWAKYCKFVNSRQNFTFENSVKRHICDIQNSRLKHDLPISVNDRVILQFPDCIFWFNFAKISEFTVIQNEVRLATFVNDPRWIVYFPAFLALLNSMIIKKKSHIL